MRVLTPGNFDCQLTEIHLGAYIDHELDLETCLQMELHGDRCPTCRKVMRAAIHLKRSIQDAVRKVNVPDRVSFTLRATLQRHYSVQE